MRLWPEFIKEPVLRSLPYSSIPARFFVGWRPGSRTMPVKQSERRWSVTLLPLLLP